MCTVTYAPVQSGFSLTSSRDEFKLRATYPPQFHNFPFGELLFPQDQKAGGTWIACDKNKNVACLLNGGFKKHPPGNVYSKSRGLVLIESFQFESPEEFLHTTNLDFVEPFTLLLLRFKNNAFNLSQCVWDGNTKHLLHLDAAKPYIFSSSTLYSEAERLMREEWFDQLQLKHKVLEENTLFNFHASHHGSDSFSDILMNRGNMLQTISITQISVSNQSARMIYNDLINNQLLAFDV
jgi:uncharacterized protein with NRDE domain